MVVVNGISYTNGFNFQGHHLHLFGCNSLVHGFVGACVGAEVSEVVPGGCVVPGAVVSLISDGVVIVPGTVVFSVVVPPVVTPVVSQTVIKMF